MTNPTTPFSWQMPTATDLVTDLPADFETFGQAVATSMADLLGGTTGQILSKASNTDMDFTWITNDVGDITAVTAGTGLSGGGTSGAVTLSIDTATTVDLTTAQTLTNKTLTSPVLTTPSISTINAKGDLLAGTADNTIAARSVGTNGQVLTADSAEATGMKWTTITTTPTFVGASAYVSGSQSIPANTLTTADFANENFDSDGFHSTSSNTSRMTVPTGKAGKYLVTGTLGVDVTSNFYTRINVNGNAINGSSYGYYNVTGTGDSNINRTQVSFGAILDLAAGDYVQLQVVHSSSTSRNLEAGRFDIGYLGA